MTLEILPDNKIQITTQPAPVVHTTTLDSLIRQSAQLQKTSDAALASKVIVDAQIVEAKNAGALTQIEAEALQDVEVVP